MSMTTTTRDERRNDPRSNAIDTLVRAGRQADVAKLYDETASRAHATYRSIREDEGRTDDWKAEQLQETYQTIHGKVTEKLVDMAASAGRAERADAERVFGTAGLTGDSASLAISSRDAGDRVAQLSTTAELRDALQRATRNGDEVFARAVVEHAIHSGDRSLVNDFLATRDSLAEPVQRLWNSARKTDDGGESFALLLKAAAIRP